jgi:hypothetical protein
VQVQKLILRVDFVIFYFNCDFQAGKLVRLIEFEDLANADVCYVELNLVGDGIGCGRGLSLAEGGRREVHAY